MNPHHMTEVVLADPDEVFRLITTPDRLPEWNRAIVGVIDAPEQLRPGAVWVVELSALKQRWKSRSTVLELDSEARYFAYRSQTDDGNASYADWSWCVTDAPGGCEVRVSFALHPRTFWRRVLFAKVRGRQIRQRELPESLRALASFATTLRDQ